MNLNPKLFFKAVFTTLMGLVKTRCSKCGSFNTKTKNYYDNTEPSLSRELMGSTTECRSCGNRDAWRN